MINYEFPPLGAGAGIASSYMLDNFSGYNDLTIDFVTSSASDYSEEKLSPNITVFRLNIAKQGKNLRYQSLKDLIIFSYKSYRFAKRLLKKNQYDLCHAFFGVPCGYLALHFGIPYIVSLRGSDVPFHNRRFYLLDKLILTRLSRKIWNKAEFVVANSDDLSRSAKKASQNQSILVINNGVDSRMFTPKSEHKPDETLRILSVSRLSPCKGIDLLIRAIYALKNEDLELTIVGEGKLSDQLENMVYSLGLKQKVIFKKQVSHNKMPQIYNRADLYILPSFNEGMSNTILEAMASGLAIIATDTGGVSSLIADNGLVIKKGSVSAIVEAITYFLQNRALIPLTGAKSRSTVMEKGWPAVSESYYGLYKKMVDSKIKKG
ncbi:MAG: glycosyltransferase family 4 protein [Candidatus Omnitrophica bacterium]|nr:glycosyltransferase family 4 protein [Candidatus Omnitrophota bacterium]